MKIIIGLGNPGRKYRKTRHNVGFMFIDQVVKDLQGKMTLQNRLRCETFLTNINGEKVLFAKPITYMNLSGEAIKLIVDYYKIPIENVLVIYDDFSLPVGKLRFRQNGTAGGHNGMQSIINHLKTQEIKRLKIGIDSPLKDNIIDFVLSRFSKKEYTVIEDILFKSENIVRDYLSQSFNNVMNTYN